MHSYTCPTMFFNTSQDVIRVSADWIKSHFFISWMTLYMISKCQICIILIDPRFIHSYQVLCTHIHTLKKENKNFFAFLKRFNIYFDSSCLSLFLKWVSNLGTKHVQIFERCICSSSGIIFHTETPWLISDAFMINWMTTVLPNWINYSTFFKVADHPIWGMICPILDYLWRVSGQFDIFDLTTVSYNELSLP